MPGRYVGFAGLILFLLFTAGLTTPRASLGDVKDYVLARTRTLFAPWVFWTVAYAGINIAVGKVPFPHGNGPVSAVLTGPWIGLWYLPFAIFFITLSTLALHLTRDLNDRIATLAWISLGFLALLTAYEVRKTFNLSTPYAQWVHALPALFLGLAFNRARKLRTGARLLTLSATSALLAFGLPLTRTDPDLGLFAPYAIAFSLITLATIFSEKMGVTLGNALAPLCFGAYLSHGVLVPIALRVVTQENRFIAFVAIALGAFSLSFLAHKTERLRRFF